MEANITTSGVGERQLQQLKAQYDRGNNQLAEGFERALASIQTSEILQVMRGVDMLPWALQHIREISTKILNSDLKESLQHAYRTISELKAQQAIMKMQLQLAKKKQQDNRRVKELEGQLRHAQAQSQLLREQTSSPKLTEIIQREIQKRVSILEKEYILKAEHEKIVADLERQNRKQGNHFAKSTNLREENDQAWKKAVEEKHEEALRRVHSHHKAEIDLLTNRIRTLENELSLRTNSQAQLQMSSAHKGSTTASPASLGCNPESEILIGSSEQIGSEKPTEPQSKKGSIPPKHESAHEYYHSGEHKSKFSQTQQNSKLKDSPSKQELDRIAAERQKSRSKFEEIQASFAKELADLRARMSEKRQKLTSPEYLRTRTSKTKQNPYSPRMPSSEEIVAGGHQSMNRR